MSLPLLVRGLGIAEFGRYIAALALVGVFALATEIGLTAMSSREFGGREAGERAGALAPLLGLRVTLAAAGTVAAVVVAALLGWSSRFVAGTAIVGAAALAQVWTDFSIVGLNGTLRFGSAAAVDLVRAAVATAAIVVLKLAGAATLAYFVAYAAAGALAAGVAVRLARGLIPLRPAVDLPSWRSVARTAAPLAVAAAVYVVHFRIVVILVSAESSARQTGYFATSFRAVEFVAAVAGAIAMAAVPYLSRQARDAAAFALRARQTLALGMVGAFVVAGLVLAVAGVVVDVVAGSAGKPAAAVLRIQSLSVLGTLAAFAGGAVLLAAGRYRAILLVNLGALALEVAFAVPLVDAHGARGGAIAAAIGDMMLFAGQLVAVRSLIRART